ncbi:MAG: GNAT family N-acetyltransferase [Erysipelotrichales bacterium]|nr:GNAT family N-acetyltransferase [Erysipelotrichales bacterium]MBQ4011088.1 GNAT family N-acetyltransferase [Erysipelotrichales bacterium]MBQ5542339.1 GNAT family N-acetyltransferase [Erysipelotrichales bacterium]
MERIVSDTVDLLLTQHYVMGTLHPYEVYYFDIFLHDKWERVGYIDLRVGRSKYLYYQGNIGYRIDEPYRGHHYALDAAKLVFPFAKEKGMDWLYITCNPDNIASRKTLDKLGGECLGDKKVPITCPLYFEGERFKRIYRFTT